MFEKKDFDRAITTIYRVYTEARNRSGIVPSSGVPADQSCASVPLAPQNRQWTDVANPSDAFGRYCLAEPSV